MFIKNFARRWPPWSWRTIHGADGVNQRGPGPRIYCRRRNERQQTAVTADLRVAMELHVTVLHVPPRIKQSSVTRV